MERDNFYIILDLSVDPPQMDSTKIEEAIKKKQTEWSRLRNHPTKGIKAQQYIGMISEIRNIMMNPKLREMEAKSALEIIRKNEELKFSNIDRHLELLMSKDSSRKKKSSNLQNTIKSMRSRSVIASG
jgi:curved DNA-binding protein CbpA